MAILVADDGGQAVRHQAQLVALFAQPGLPHDIRGNIRRDGDDSACIGAPFANLGNAAVAERTQARRTVRPEMVGEPAGHIGVDIVDRIRRVTVLDHRAQDSGEGVPGPQYLVTAGGEIMRLSVQVGEPTLRIVKDDRLGDGLDRVVEGGAGLRR